MNGVILAWQDAAKYEDFMKYGHGRKKNTSREGGVFQTKISEFVLPFFFSARTS